jgi:hypothetical protein
MNQGNAFLVNFSRWLFTASLAWMIAVPTTVFAKDGKKSHPVKKVDVTPNTNDDGVWTFTLESNAYQSTVYLNPILDYSSTDGWDVQIASYSIPVYGGGAQNYEWDSYINLSKTFELNEDFKTLIGSQNGTTLFSNTRRWHNFDYGLLIYQATPALNLHAGPYWAGRALTTTSNEIGYTAGLSYEFIEDTLLLQGDYFSGSSSVSGAVVNLFYSILPNAQINVGVGVPETKSGNEFYGIVGFSVASKAY